MHGLCLILGLLSSQQAIRPCTVILSPLKFLSLTRQCSHKSKVLTQDAVHFIGNTYLMMVEVIKKESNSH